MGVVELVLVLALFVLGGRQALGIGFFVLAAALTGWLVASRVPGNPLGWILQFCAGCFLLAFVAYGVGNLTVGWSESLTAWLGWFAGTDDWGWLWLPAVGLLFTQMLLRFPDGRLPSPRWRWFSRFSLVVLVAGTSVLALAPADLRHGAVNPVAVPWLSRHGGLIVPALGLCLAVAFIGSAASLFVRYRRADDLARHQLRWVAWAAALVVGFYVASFVLRSPVIDNLVTVAYALIPAAMAVAVLRYRLYDIDRIVSRTVAYGLVTGVLVLTYAAVVTTVSRLLPGSSTLAVSAATLAAAALLRPVLSRTQSAVDRRFNRERFDAELTVERFGASLRREVDVEAVLHGLTQTVNVTMQPDHIAIWRADDS